MLFVLNMSTHADDFQWPGLSAQESRLYRDIPKILFKIFSRRKDFVNAGIFKDVEGSENESSELCAFLKFYQRHKTEFWKIF
jgi:hypothetical protein